MAKTITQTTTHLITTDTDFAKPSAKVKQAQGMQLPIVTLEWLEDCLAQSTKLDETSYALDATATATGLTAPSTASVAGSRKRAVSTDDEDDDSQPPPQPKKKGATAASSKGKAKAQPAAPPAPDLKMTVRTV